MAKKPTMIPRYKDGGLVKAPAIGFHAPKAQTPKKAPYRGPVPNREGMRYTGTINGQDSYRDFSNREYVDVDPRRGSMRQTPESMAAEATMYKHAAAARDEQMDADMRRGAAYQRKHRVK